MNEAEKRVDRAEKNLERLLKWVERHDARNTGLFGIVAGMIGALSAVVPEPSKWTGSLKFALVLSILMLAYVMTQILLSQFPRMRAPASSLLYFGTIADFGRDDYTAKFASLNDERYLDDLVIQCHTNAQIVRRKFRYFGNALVGLTISALPWMAAIYLSK